MPSNGIPSPPVEIPDEQEVNQRAVRISANRGTPVFQKLFEGRMPSDHVKIVHDEEVIKGIVITPNSDPYDETDKENLKIRDLP